MSTLAADSVFHELADPEKSCTGSPWQRHASLWKLILFSWRELAGFFATDFLNQKDLSLLIPKTEIVTSRTGVTSLARKKTQISNHNFSASAWPEEHIFLLVLVNQDTDLKYCTPSTSVSSFPRTQELISSQDSIQVILVSVDSTTSWEFQQSSTFFQIAFFLAMFPKATEWRNVFIQVYYFSYFKTKVVFCQFCYHTESLYMEVSQKFSVNLDMKWFLISDNCFIYSKYSIIKSNGCLFANM